MNYELSKVSFPLFLLHACFLVEVDDACCAFALRCCHHLLYNLLDCGGVALHGSRQRPAAKGAEANHTHVNLRHKLLWQAVVVGHDEVAVNLYARTFLREIEGYDGDILEADVLPDIELSPVREREELFLRLCDSASVQCDPGVEPMHDNSSYNLDI